MAGTMTLAAPGLAAGSVPGPVLVVRVDVGEPLPVLSPVRSGGVDYVAAWVVVVCGGRPLGHVEVDLRGGVVGAGELRERVVAVLGDVFSGSGCGSGLVVGDGLLPVVSVVVASTFERVELLERCVASLVGQDYPDFEVVVVDNRPVGTPQRLGLWGRLCVDGRVRVVGEVRRGSSAARNRGASVARGEVLAFTDDDVVVESGWLRALGSRFVVDAGTACVTGLVLPRELETPAQIWFERSGSNLDQDYDVVCFGTDAGWSGGRPRGWGRRRFEVVARREDGSQERFLQYRAGRFGMTASMAVRADVFRALGGFDEGLGPGRVALTGEDHLLLVRLLHSGWRLTLDPAAYVFHTHRREYGQLVRQLYAYGSGYTAMLVALVRDDPRHLVGLFWYGLQAGRLLLRKFGRRRPAVGDYPSELSRAELRGLLSGPWRYVWGRWVAWREVRAGGGGADGVDAAGVGA